MIHYQKEYEIQANIIKAQGIDLDRVLDECQEWKQKYKTLKKTWEDLKDDAENGGKMRDEYYHLLADAANETKLFKKENERIQELVETLQAEKKFLKYAIKSAEEKYNAEKSQNASLREEIDALKAKSPPSPPDEKGRPPLRRRPSGANASEDKTHCPNSPSESGRKTKERKREKADKTTQQRPRSRSPSRKRSVSRTQEADNTSDRKARILHLTGKPAEGDWGTSA